MPGSSFLKPDGFRNAVFFEAQLFETRPRAGFFSYTALITVIGKALRAAV
jgi:hypothetical protein